MEVILVGLGGAFGSITRFIVEKIITNKNDSVFPVATFLINITGSLFLGIISCFFIEKYIYLFIAGGFLGSYTTFSTFMYQLFDLSKDRKKIAFLYLVLSIIIGVIFFILGYEFINFA